MRTKKSIELMGNFWALLKTPSLNPKHETFDLLKIIVGGLGWVIDVDIVSWHPFASVAITE